MTSDQNERVSRRKYERSVRAREAAEKLLEEKSRQLYQANKELDEYSKGLEKAVRERTAELSDALREAEKAAEMKARFIATMSHEIRTPLGGLLGMIDLVLGDEADDEKKEYLEYAKASGHALRRIVNDVLDFSKLETGAFQYNDEPVDIRALVNGVVEMSRASLGVEANRLKAEISANVPALFLGDGTRVRQVIANLVSNAIRYSHDGDIIVRASQRHLEGSELLRVEVEDSGIGIDQAKIPDLFKDFTQIQNELTSVAQGAGLGLAISKRIIEGAGGIIGVDTEIEVGSNFWFELPITVLEASDLTEYQPSNTMKTAQKLKSDTTILLVEDNQINQMLLFNFLDRMGVGVELASNGQIAVDKFKPGKFDLILMDVAMPVMDGLQAIRKIRATWNDEEIPPIALLTAHLMESIEDDGKAVGVSKVLSKPITYEDLRDAIFDILHGSEKSDKQVRKKAASSPIKVGQINESNSTDKPQIEATSINVLFKSDSNKLLLEIKNALEANDRERVRIAAHSLKGSSSMLGFASISEFAGQIEDSYLDVDHEILSEMSDLISNEIAKIQI